MGERFFDGEPMQWIDLRGLKSPRAALGLIIAGGLLVTSPARAEIFQLIDKTQVAGKLLHYYEGLFHIEVAGGQKIELPKDKVKSVSFEVPRPRAEFSSPEKTFKLWYDALAKGDQRRFIDCYALMYQGLVNAQLAQGSDELRKMQKELEDTKVEVKATQITGDNAALKVQKSKGDEVLTADIHMVMENGEWKMTP